MCHSDNPLKNRPFCANTALKDHGTRKRYRGLLLCLTQKWLIFKCFAVLPSKIFFCTDGLSPKKHCRVSRTKTFLQRKRSRQNRINHYGAPPNSEALFIIAFPPNKERLPYLLLPVQRQGGTFQMLWSSCECLFLPKNPYDSGWRTLLLWLAS